MHVNSKPKVLHVYWKTTCCIFHSFGLWMFIVEKRDTRGVNYQASNLFICQLLMFDFILYKTLWYLCTCLLIVMKMKSISKRKRAIQCTGKQNHLYMFLMKEYKDILLSSLVNIDQPTKQNFINFKYIHYLWKGKDVLAVIL